ncbi:universal stress protein [Janthinobacterium fluminis]|uniref:Universal stress protein n=1 Tax=Janthinobacterium fluminis TaxID=2987524 RepID=A0ABT5JTD8_9BURK|nr:universal stress protein [Janthinobacterium fluminis]MDC8755994.1 universal stress protein [Janthinobacterium fluminis]
MPYKTILVHVDQSHQTATRIDLALQLAAADGAHLIGAASTGISAFLHQHVGDAGAPSLAPYLDILRQRADAALAQFEQQVRRANATSFELRRIDDEAAPGISLSASFCDLAILGQTDPGQANQLLGPDFPEYVAIHSGCPVLIVPYAGAFASVGAHVLVGWNGSLEARRAVRDALPLLRRARTVELAVFNPRQQDDAHGQQAGADIALHLARHGVAVSVREEAGNGDVGEALLSLAADSGADLLVMGCYGHARLREVLLGGTTRTVLQAMTVPVLMAH